MKDSSSKETNDFTFSQLPTAIREMLDSQGIKDPTPIQKEAIPLALSGLDILAQSQTGSGKTLAFAIPVGMLLNKSPQTRNPRALVLAPTRELALQVETVFKLLSKPLGFKCLSVIGGTAYRKQFDQLRSGVDLIIGTPGRVVDLLEKKALNLDSIQHYVLDEVDQMLDIGFAKDLDTISEALPENKQTLFFSATLDGRTKSLANQLLKEHEELRIQGTLHAPKSIEHFYVPVNSKQEIPALINLLLNNNKMQGLIFCATKQECRDVTGELQERGFNTAALNSDLNQEAREEALVRFREGKLQYLVATNVMARGIDIQGLPLVINFDVPFDAESYTHRTGRTGRAGEEGLAWSIISPRNFRRFWDFMDELRIEPQKLAIPKPEEIFGSFLKKEVVRLQQYSQETRNKIMLEMVANSIESLSLDDIKEIVQGHLLMQCFSMNLFDVRGIHPTGMGLSREEAKSRRSYGRNDRNDRPRNNGGKGRSNSSNSSGPKWRKKDGEESKERKDSRPSGEKKPKKPSDKAGSKFQAPKNQANQEYAWKKRKGKQNKTHP